MTDFTYVTTCTDSSIRLIIYEFVCGDYVLGENQITIEN